MASQPISVESIPLATAKRESLEREIPEGGVHRENINGEIVVFQKTGGILSASRVMAVHPIDGDQWMQFPMSIESDGTRRLIDILPAFADLGDPQSKYVYIIDELDRGLHTNILKYLVQMFVSQSTEDSRSQIVFTTHNVELMTRNLLRRDEMWLVEKNDRGESRLVPFSDVNGAMRNDSDIRRSYLQGRLGGIPRIVPFDFSESDDSGNHDAAYPEPDTQETVASELTSETISAIAMEAAP